MEQGDQTSSNSLEVISMIIWLSTGNGKFFELHGSRDTIKQVLPKSSESAFRWGYYNSPADPDRQSYTQVLEAFLKSGFHIEGSSGAGTQGLLRTQYILVKRN
ncbi:unnamed protein product [Adineta ricciae]|uniref:Uncharacterized protein n=1 Tax=Adineta ricciae TaxID=249248 RepID=A0A814ECG6_ADIRI|nr:unnamed protein product [Adineta ricciae]CAF0966100.1 unnamed protein product [Adineta ricciae]